MKPIEIIDFLKKQNDGENPSFDPIIAMIMYAHQETEIRDKLILLYQKYTKELEAELNGVVHIRPKLIYLKKEIEYLIQNEKT